MQELLQRCHSYDHHERRCTGYPIESSTFPGRYFFCEIHQEELDRIRKELEAGAWERNVRNKDGAEEAYCDMPGCSNRPIYGGDYCSECSGGDD